MYKERRKRWTRWHRPLSHITLYIVREEILSMKFKKRFSAWSLKKKKEPCKKLKKKQNKTRPPFVRFGEVGWKQALCQEEKDFWLCEGKKKNMYFLTFVHLPGLLEISASQEKDWPGWWIRSSSNKILCLPCVHRLFFFFVQQNICSWFYATSFL